MHDLEEITIALETESGIGMIVRMGGSMYWEAVSATADMILTLAGRAVEGWDA